MLVLTRKLGEAVVIDENIRISIVEVKGKQVRIGIEAPSHISINREEIYKSLQNQNQKASQTNNELLKQLTQELDT